MDALHGDDESALLAAADASLTDERRSAEPRGEVKVVDGALDDFLDGLGPRLGFAGFIAVNLPARETQSRGEHERLFRRERVEENVILRDVPQVAQQASRVWVNSPLMTNEPLTPLSLLPPRTCISEVLPLPEVP